MTVTRLIHAREDPIRSNSLNGRILDLFIRVMTPRVCRVAVRAGPAAADRRARQSLRGGGQNLSEGRIMQPSGTVGITEKSENWRKRTFCKSRMVGIRLANVYCRLDVLIIVMHSTVLDLSIVGHYWYQTSAKEKWVSRNACIL